MSTLLGNYVTPVPAQQRLGPRWFAGQRRRDLPVPQPDLRRASPTTSSSSAPTTSTGWTPRRWSSRTSPAGAGVTVAGIRVPRSRGLAVRRDRHRAGRPARSTRSWRSRPTRRAPGRPGRDVRVDGQLRVHHRRVARGAARRTPTTRLRPRHGRRHHPDACRKGDAEVYDFADNDVPGATDRDRGYWRDVGTIGLLLRRAHGPGVDPPGLQPLQPRVADRHGTPQQPGREVRPGRQLRPSRPCPSARSSSDGPVDNSVLSPGRILRGA